MVALVRQGQDASPRSLQVWAELARTRLVAERVGQQLHRAPHVVIDLGDVRVLGPRGLTVLSTLHQQALERGHNCTSLAPSTMRYANRCTPRVWRSG